MIVKVLGNYDTSKTQMEMEKVIERIPQTIKPNWEGDTLVSVEVREDTTLEDIQDLWDEAYPSFYSAEFYRVLKNGLRQHLNIEPQSISREVYRDSLGRTVQRNRTPYGTWY